MTEVVSPASGLQREASLDVEDEFHRAPEISNELQTTPGSPANAGEPGISESSSHGDVFPRPEEIACTTGEGKEGGEVEQRAEASLLSISQESVAVDQSEKNNDVYQGIESEEDRENRQAMEAWEAQRGIQEVGFREEQQEPMALTLAKHGEEENKSGEIGEGVVNGIISSHLNSHIPSNHPSNMVLDTQPNTFRESHQEEVAQPTNLVRSHEENLLNGEAGVLKQELPEELGAEVKQEEQLVEQVPGELGEQTVEVTTEGQEYVMGGSYIDYGYPVEPEGEATVQVEYVGSADIQRMATEATIEYVTISGADEGLGWGPKVIGVLREPGLYEGADFVNRPVQQGSDLVEAAINSVGMGGRDDGYLMPGLADSRRDLPPPPPQFDDPPPATGLDQFGRGREYTTLTTLDTASYPGYQLASSPTRFQADPPFSISSPSFYTGTPTITQAASSRPYPNTILQPAGHYDLAPWVHYDTTPFSQHSQHPTLSTESIADSSYKTLTGSRGILGDFNHYVPSVAASPGFSLHHTESNVQDHSSLPRYTPSSQESTSDPFSPATGGECLTCGAALTGGRQWRSSNPTSSQLCDSCANYSKMNRPPGSNSTSGGRGSPPSRSKSGGTAPAPTGNRRTGMNCANCSTNTTTLWRRNNAGEPVCNACGLYFKLHGINRPPSKKNEGIRSRKRKPKNANGTKEPRKQSKAKPPVQSTPARAPEQQPVNYRLETRNDGGSVKMEMVLSPDLEQEMLLSNIKHSQQVLMAQLKSPEELHYGSLALGDPMMGRGQDPTYAYLRAGGHHESSGYSPSPLLHSSQATASPLLSQTSAQAHSPHPMQEDLHM